MEVDRAQLLASDERLQEFTDLAQEMEAVLAEVYAVDGLQANEGKSIFTGGKLAVGQSDSDIEHLLHLSFPDNNDIVGKSGGGVDDSPVWGLAPNYSRDYIAQDTTQVASDEI